VREGRNYTEREEQTTKPLSKAIENREVWTRTLLYHSCDFETIKEGENPN
jgi:hypothetical protein